VLLDTAVEVGGYTGVAEGGMVDALEAIDVPPSFALRASDGTAILDFVFSLRRVHNWRIIAYSSFLKRWNTT